MRLEDEIKQSAFSTEQSKLIVNLIYTSNRLKEKSQHALNQTA